MNISDRKLLTDLKLHVEYIRKTVDSLDNRVAIQNGRVTESEKKIQHIVDTVNEKTISTQIHSAIECNESLKQKRQLAVTGAVVAIITLIINMAFFIYK